jgi:hypothetical protein
MSALGLKLTVFAEAERQLKFQTYPPSPGDSLKASDKNADPGDALLQKIDLLFGIIDWLTILDPTNLAPARLIVCKPQTYTKTLVREPFQ